MIITSVTEHAEIGQPFFRALLSDFHLGSANSDHNAITHDLEEAKRIGARILINGDVFDAIGPKDKRFQLGTLHPDVEGKKDLAKAIVDLAVELLMPYRSLIDVIGIGNHEEAWINYGYNDPVRRTIEELRRAGGSVRHGSFWGFVKTSFVIKGQRSRPKHRLLYLHGTGGDSPVTKGTIDFNRKGRNWAYDCLTFGHKHNIVCAVDQIAEVSDSGKYRERRQLNLQTGSYYRNYRQLTDDTCLDYSYAARSAHPPKPIGGLTLVLRPTLDDHGDLQVTQDFASAIVSPWSKSKVISARVRLTPTDACSADSDCHLPSRPRTRSRT